MNLFRPMLALGLLWWSAACGSDRSTITGRVVGEGRGIANASVAIMGTVAIARTDALGRFTLTAPDGEPFVLSAWAEGRYSTVVEGVRPGREVEIRLARTPTLDNPDYAWLPPDGPGGCATCHPEVVAVWKGSAHARSVENPRFRTMYLGTDLAGNASPPTVYAERPDLPWAAGQLFPLPPDPSQPYYGPGFKLDFPGLAGTCASCHAPSAATAGDVDPTLVSGVPARGVHCDYCHKVAGVRLEADGLPAGSKPGVNGSVLTRPFPGNPETAQIFYGPLPDPNAATGDAFLPLQRESRFCAPCHHGSFWGVVIYDSFGEWLRSPYSDPQSGKTCQECHMPAPTLVDGVPLTNFAAGNGGRERDPSTLRAHQDLGVDHVDFMRTAVRLEVVASRNGDAIDAVVTLTNVGAGHHVPTDSPLRQLILLVEARDASGAVLERVEGPTVPSWAGEGSPAEGRYAGKPGQGYAKILEEVWTGISPTGAYWNQIRLVSDNRLAALASDTTRYSFRATPNAAVVSVRLLFRRAYKVLMDQKGWADPDLTLAEETISLPPG